MHTLAERRRVAVVTDMITAINRREMHRLEEFFAADFVLNGTPWDADRLRAELDKMIDAFPDFQWRIEFAVVDGKRLACRLHDTGTHMKDFRGVRATGLRMQANELALYRFEGRKIVELWLSADQVLLRDQMLDIYSGDPHSSS
ncbi:ester cyclase [Solicola sp. PLA-1-18]|uniref:ester cyclase n=1 Tax=Solicola sp. PLA-1-18 TaxID=3380532 RepID=UPI003B75F24C